MRNTGSMSSNVAATSDQSTSLASFPRDTPRSSSLVRVTNKIQWNIQPNVRILTSLRRSTDI